MCDQIDSDNAYHIMNYLSSLALDVYAVSGTHFPGLPVILLADKFCVNNPGATALFDVSFII